MTDEWVVCTSGVGRLHEHGIPENRTSNFRTDSVALVKEVLSKEAVVWLIGANQDWTVPLDSLKRIDLTQTGDKFDKKICNLCHRLLPTTQFAKNQTNLHGPIRRPSCNRCRTDIDKRAPKSKQAQQMEKERPDYGTPFKCPICQKRSIVGVTAKIVADHDHHTGDIRDFICDSCNTGLGRFKDNDIVLSNAIEYLRMRDSLSD